MNGATMVTSRSARWIGAGIVLAAQLLQLGIYWSRDVLAGMVG
jgi:hypothetical protein